MISISRVTKLRRLLRNLFCATLLEGLPGLLVAYPISLSVEHLAPELMRIGRNEQIGRARAEFRSELDRAVKSFRQGQRDPALRLLESAVRAHPELPSANLMLARLLLQDGEFAQTRAMLRRAIDENPFYPGAYVTFAELALAEGRLDESKENLDRAWKLAQDERWTPQRNQLLPRILENLIVTAARANDWNGARIHASAWLDLDPDNVSVRQRLAQALFRLGESKGAYAEFEKAAAADRRLEPPLISLARLYADAGDLGKAIEWMDKAIKTDPANLHWQRTKATLLLRHGEAAQAARQLDATAKLDGNARETRILRGLVARYVRDYVRAEHVFEALHRESPVDSFVDNQLALVLVEQPDKSKQGRALHLALANARLFHTSAEALSTLGWIYYRFGSLDEAERVLLAAQWLGFESSDAAYYLARVSVERNRPDRAKQLLKAALDRPGLFLFRKEAQEWLRQMETGRVGGASVERPVARQ